jgi:two-component system chemotaxis sensor kinase CheA
MGLAVNEIVDIVDERLDIELVADRSDLVGSAVIRGRATEVVNVAHYLPLVAESWMRSSSPQKAGGQTVLLVEGSNFFRDMLAPVLKTAGYRVQLAASAEEALHVLAQGVRIDMMVTDVDLPGRSGFELVEALRSSPLAGLPVIALTAAHDPRQIELAHRLQISELVAKFDRRGLLAALSELNGTLEVAA